MNVISMKYRLKNATFSALAALFSVASAFCMEAEKVIFREKSAEVLSLVLAERINFFNHHDICVIGSIDKACNKIAMQTALPRRKILEERIAQESKGNRVTWHKYGSGYVDFFIDTKIMGSGMRFFSLGDNKEVSHFVSYGFYESIIPKLERAIFDEKGSFNFYYLYGYKARWGYFSEGINPDIHIVEFFYNSLSNQLCVLQCIWESCEYKYPFSTFKAFPTLLKAFLNSSFVCKPVFMGDQTIDVKLFNLQDAIIPDNYRDEPSFYTLPDILQKALDERYRVQGQKEKIITECFKTEELCKGKFFGKKPCCIQ